MRNGNKSDFNVISNTLRSEFTVHYIDKISACYYHASAARPAKVFNHQPSFYWPYILLSPSSSDLARSINRSHTAGLTQLSSASCYSLTMHHVSLTSNTRVRSFVSCKGKSDGENLMKPAGHSLALPHDGPFFIKPGC